MTEPVTHLPLLERRRIEAAVLIPLIRAFQAEFGETRTNEIVGRTIQEVARSQGQAAGRVAGEVSLLDVAANSERGVFAEGSLTVEIVERTESRFGFDVTRCQFMEMYEAMDARDLGFLLSCGRDFAYFEGLAPGVQFSRSQTRMEGASHCDFRYAVADDSR